jgi:hypothetical protein
MIIMGSQGRTGLSHVMLGSKAEQVVRLASLSVMIVKDGKEKSPETGTVVSRITKQAPSIRRRFQSCYYWFSENKQFSDD